MGSMWFDVFDVVRCVRCCAVKSIESSRRFEISQKVCSIIFLTIAGNVRFCSLKTVNYVFNVVKETLAASVEHVQLHVKKRQTR